MVPTLLYTGRRVNSNRNRVTDLVILVIRKKCLFNNTIEKPSQGVLYFDFEVVVIFIKHYLVFFAIKS